MNKTLKDILDILWYVVVFFLLQIVFGAILGAFKLSLGTTTIISTSAQQCRDHLRFLEVQVDAGVALMDADATLDGSHMGCPALPRLYPPLGALGRIASDGNAGADG